jgi:L-amino acid N-acyltransferase YncA
MHVATNWKEEIRTKKSKYIVIEMRSATLEDSDQIWEIIHEVIVKGDTYTFSPNSSRETMLKYWFGIDRYTYVATENEKVVATFMIRDNQPGLGSHVANGSYMVPEKSSGKGIGKKIGEFSLAEAKRLGYKAMQFNIVIKSNVRAVELWQKLGFSIIGEIPDAFNHTVNGMTNAYIMYRKL